MYKRYSQNRIIIKLILIRNIFSDQLQVITFPHLTGHAEKYNCTINLLRLLERSNNIFLLVETVII